MKATPIIYIMFSVVIIALTLVSLASYYGSDWTWISNIIAGFIVLFIVFGVAFYTLIGWLKQ